MRLVKVIAASSVLYVISFVQPIQILAQETFHVRGRIVDSLHSEVAGAEVKFEGSKTTETVFSDRQGFYHARLPIGLYSMTVAKDPLRYRRPPFRVSAPKMIVIDVTLFPHLSSCDPGSISVTRPDGTTEAKTVGTPDDLKDGCGGWDRYPLPSSEGIPFELFVRYVSRVRRDGERIYNGGFHDPVFVAFDLFTLTADRVTYDQSSRTLLAAGDVTTTNGIRPRTHANSMKFRIANDRVLRLP
jgi:Carboxypeptidase regulatory-like domain